jgi:hypothetical protein
MLARIRIDGGTRVAASLREEQRFDGVAHGCSVTGGTVGRCGRRAVATRLYEGGPAVKGWSPRGWYRVCPVSSRPLQTPLSEITGQKSRGGLPESLRTAYNAVVVSRGCWALRLFRWSPSEATFWSGAGSRSAGCGRQAETAASSALRERARDPSSLIEVTLKMSPLGSGCSPRCIVTPPVDWPVAARAFGVRRAR